MYFRSICTIFVPEIKKTVMKRRFFFACLLMVLGLTGVWADEMTERQAEAYAMRFTISYFDGQFDESEFKLQGQVCGLYVFSMSEAGGFVIVSSDDRTIPILGFSDNGVLDLENMPDEQRAWLQGYADEIEWLKNQPYIDYPVNTRAGSHEKETILPLVTTKWNQRAPYNDLCPDYSASKRSVTGCVATAMAQVMNYHKWPVAATEAIPGYRDGYGVNQTPLEPTTFDWGNMLDSYGDSETQEQKTAVARLMQYCGYAVEMNYGPTSGASMFKVATALKNYFDYNGTTTYLSRSFYTNDKWEDIIYHELASNRPVLYGGQSTGGGHAFVCDGYRYEYGTDFFHINWGWGGKSDEYYVLSVLDPYSGQGTGGSSSTGGFYFGQEAIIGIQKSTDAGTMTDITPAKIDLTANSMTLSHNTIILGETETITLNITNNSSDDFDGDIYVGISGSLLVGGNFMIPAGQTQDCVLIYKPTATGFYNLLFFEPLDNGHYGSNSGVLATLNVVDETPTDLSVSDISTTSAMLSWTQAGTPTSWVVAYKAAGDSDFTEIQAETNPFTLTGLNPETPYTVKVRPVIGELIMWSSSVTFTTEALRLPPTNLTVSDITATSAVVSWEGSASSYDVRYGLIPESGDDSSVWLRYDEDDIENISVQGFSLPETTWGVMYPGSMVTGNKLTKIAFYETYLNTEPFTVNIYSGGDKAPGTLLHTEVVTPMTGNGSNLFVLHEIVLTPAVSIAAGENLWITLTEKGQYPVACYQSTTIPPNNQWLLFADKWYQVGDLISGFSSGWMIRGFMETENLDAVEWSAIENCTELSYALTGLTASKDYVVQVRGNYGQDDYSKWETTTFSTLEEVVQPEPDPEPDPDGIKSVLVEPEDDGVWYTLDGRRLNGPPTSMGLYIRKNKVVIK